MKFDFETGRPDADYIYLSTAVQRCRIIVLITTAEFKTARKYLFSFSSLGNDVKH